MLRSVTHKHQCFILFHRRQPFQQSLRRLFIVLLRMKQRHSHGNAQPQPERLQLRKHLLVFLPVHHMGGLDGHMGIALGLQTLHGLGHGIDFHPVPLLELSDNHSAGEGPAHLPVRKGFPQHFLCGSDGALKGIRIGSAERNSKNRLFHTIFSCCIFKMDAVKAKAQTA